jgi:hypothetical protein
MPGTLIKRSQPASRRARTQAGATLCWKKAHAACDCLRHKRASAGRYLRKNGRSVNAGSAMNSLLVIFALKGLVEYFIDSRTRSRTASIADTNRDGNPARNSAYVAPLTKSDVFLALADVSFPTEFANRRFFFSWHSRVPSPWVNPMDVTLHLSA